MFGVPLGWDSMRVVGMFNGISSLISRAHSVPVIDPISQVHGSSIHGGTSAPLLVLLS